MRLALAAAFALCACGQGLTRGDMSLGFDGGPVGLIPPGSVADAGSDAGTDGGPDAGDAGCTTLSLNTTTIVDGCFGGALAAPGSVSVNSNCAASINTGFTICTGPVSGAQDSFDGGCGGYLCTSPSLPGIINCGSCTIIVDGGP